MSPRYNFTKLFQNEVKRRLHTKGIPVESEYDLDGDKIKAQVDLYFRSPDGKEYLIELEIHRADPSNNIAKIAYLLNNDNAIRTISVIQVFSPHYLLASGTSAKMRARARCRLHVERNIPVIGEGSLNSSIVFIGEAPGRNEDRTGKPFVGAAGQVLNQMLEHIGLERDEVYITNVVKCRPPSNRQPLSDEVEACTPFLDRQLETIKPPILAPMGNSATGYTMKRFGLKERSIGQIHGRKFAIKPPWGLTIIFPLYHPATMLYNPSIENILLADFESLKELLTEKTRRLMSL